MKIFIDNREVDIDSSTVVKIGFSAAEALSPKWARVCYAADVEIPATTKNRTILGDAEQIRSHRLFNSMRHTVRVEENGSVVAEGDMLLSASVVGGERRYRFDIVGEGASWVLSAIGRIGSLPVEYSSTLSGATIAQSWTAPNAPVRFFPVDRYPIEGETATPSIPSMRVLTVSDYHPFLHIKTLIDALFARSGYTLVSEFFDTPFFDSLYMSGRYAERDVARLVERMDFRAGRFADVSAVANSAGYLFADPYSNYNTIGNIVECADPTSLDESGRRIDGVFNNGYCFGFEGDRICFTPKTTVSVGFCYRLNYVTDYRIASRTRLKGFDTFRLHQGDERSFTIPNTFVDRRGETLSGNRQYRVIVFSPTAGTQYRLSARETAGNDEGVSAAVTLCNFSTRSALFSRSTSGRLTSLSLSVVVGSTVTPFTGDWAVYDGYVGETGEKEIDITLREAPVIATPSSPKYFDTVRFGGAESGMRFTLLSTTSVRPVFVPHPTDGSNIDFGDLAVGLPSVQQLLAALRQMFNLVFCTDTFGRRVYVEPRTAFHAAGGEVDWSSRLDLSHEVIVEELGG